MDIHSNWWGDKSEGRKRTQTVKSIGWSFAKWDASQMIDIVDASQQYVRTNLLQEGGSQSQLIAPTSCWSLHNSSIIVFVVWLIEGMENSNKWGRDCLKETRINLYDVVEVVGEGAIERQNTDENRMEWGDLDLSICSQLTLSGSFSRHLLARGTSQSYQVSQLHWGWLRNLYFRILSEKRKVLRREMHESNMHSEI